MEEEQSDEELLPDTPQHNNDNNSVLAVSADYINEELTQRRQQIEETSTVCPHLDAVLESLFPHTYVQEEEE